MWPFRHTDEVIGDDIIHLSFPQATYVNRHAYNEIKAEPMLQYNRASRSGVLVSRLLKEGSFQVEASERKEGGPSFVLPCVCRVEPLLAHIAIVVASM